MDLVRYMREAGVPIGPGTRVMEVRSGGRAGGARGPALLPLSSNPPPGTHSTDSVSDAVPFGTTTQLGCGHGLPGIHALLQGQ